MTADGGFGRFLASIDRGRVIAELDGKLSELVEAVHDTGKPGTLTVKLKVGLRKGDTGTVEVSAATTHALPQPDHNAVFFIDRDYTLTRDDPTMEPMFSRSDVENGD